VEEDPGQHCRDHDAGLANGGDGRRRGVPQGKQDEKVRSSRQHADGDRRRRRGAAHAPRADERRVDDGGGDHHEQRVRRRVGMANPIAINNCVAPDHRRDQQSEHNPMPAVRTPDEQHAGRDDEHADRLGRREIRADERDRDHERRNRRRAACDGVDDRQLEAAVRRGEQRDVRELEQSGRDDVPPDAGVDVPGHRCDGHEHDDERHDGDGGRGLRVARPAQEQVPDRVQECGAERQPERRRRHLFFRDQRQVGGHEASAGRLVDHVHGLVLSVCAGDPEQHRQPADRAELSFLGDRPAEDERRRLAAKVTTFDLRHAVHEHLDLAANVRGKLDTRLHVHGS
jgi:hypothetical protein